MDDGEAPASQHRIGEGIGAPGDQRKVIGSSAGHQSCCEMPAEHGQRGGHRSRMHVLPVRTHGAHVGLHRNERDAETIDHATGALERALETRLVVERDVEALHEQRSGHPLPVGTPAVPVVTIDREGGVHSAGECGDGWCISTRLLGGVSHSIGAMSAPYQARRTCWNSPRLRSSDGDAGAPPTLSVDPVSAAAKTLAMMKGSARVVTASMCSLGNLNQMSICAMPGGDSCAEQRTASSSNSGLRTSNSQTEPAEAAELDGHFPPIFAARATNRPRQPVN